MKLLNLIKIYLCWWILDFPHLVKIISYAVMLHLSGENFCFLVFTVIS
jgi:hypothetical protein